MAASSHGSRRFTAEEVLEEVFADRDSEFSDEESEDDFEYTKKMMKVAKKPKVSRKMRHLIEAKEEEGAVVVEKEVFVVEEEALVVQPGVLAVVEEEALVVLDNHVVNKLFNKRLLKHSGFQWTKSQMFLLSLALLG